LNIKKRLLAGTSFAVEKGKAKFFTTSSTASPSFAHSGEVRIFAIK
jgi:hypothetical protein